MDLMKVKVDLVFLALILSPHQALHHRHHQRNLRKVVFEIALIDLLAM